MLQAHHHVEQLFDVPPEAFDPPPRVESSVVRLITRAEPLAKDVDSLERLMAMAFAQRRKMLRGTLMPWLRSQGLDPEDTRFGLEPTARPEDVAVTQWAGLADALFALRGAAPAR
jgi:16S rRNA (adenine1518-N6/adenine1519-N6)-dimethyltransferase